MQTHDILHRNEGGDNVRLDVYLSAAAGAKAVTATSDGLTTAVMPATSRFVTITSAAATDIARLPTGVVGWTIRAWVGANGCELRTPAASNEKINSVDSDGTNQAAIPATTFLTLTYTGTTAGWIMEAVDELGAPITAIVPDPP
jgi:hypothetical protein